MRDYAGRRVYGVTELTALLSQELETAFPDIWVEGEVSNFKRAVSGHLYFTLKDEKSALRAVMFRTHAMRLPFDPESGMRLLARGRLSVYSGSGDLQLYTTALEPAGLGALQMALEQAKKRLAAEGLTDPARRRPIPPFPKRVAVVTSAEGAALRDVLSVLQRRRAGFEVVVVHSPVQGAEAPASLLRALARAARVEGVEVVLLTRGGGALEDLWAFNDEALARAVAECPVPVISAVGHEVDTVLTDLTADLRAPTPSVGAELLTQARERALALVEESERRLRYHTQSLLFRLAERLDRGGHPRMAELTARRVEGLAERLDRAESDLHHGWTETLSRWESRVALAQRSLGPEGLRRWVEGLRQRQAAAARRLEGAARGRLRVVEESLRRHALLLDAVSPLRTLARGFALATDAEGRLVTDASRVSPGAALSVRLRKGRLACTVDATHPEEA